MLTIAEEIFLLVLNDAKGSIPNAIAIPLRYTLHGAILAELMLACKFRLNEHHRALLWDERPCGDPILDEALASIKNSQANPHKISYWIREMHAEPKKLLKSLGQRLVQKGILHQEEKRYLWVVPYTVFPQQDASAKYWVKQHLRGVVLAGEVADAHSLMVLSLISAGHLLDFVFTRDEMKAARKRVEKITSTYALDPDVLFAVEEIDTAVNQLVVMALSA